MSSLVRASHRRTGTPPLGHSASLAQASADVLPRWDRPPPPGRSLRPLCDL